MPLGIQRLNAKRSHPNDRIVFIKPLKGPDEKIAQDFLERIAAQCVPIMRDHHLSVMSLEEYEPNPEFVGRNFNAGEVIQLVLKTRSGHWLPFSYVQMVMMHELAHCKQMNHSRAFWAVRNQYAEQMRALWSRGYTGEGLWGRGALLSTGEFEKNTIGPGEPLPEHLCGGTYRSRGRKRKVKKSLTYKEQKERRILKKFGANGVTLGEDPQVKQKLEGKKVASKPRVAGSARGRELRAAAALARFEQQKKEEESKAKGEEVVKEEEAETGSETESGDDYEDEAISGPDAVDIDGKKLLDSKGCGMVRVCEDENPNDQDAQDELRELLTYGVRRIQTSKAASKPPDPPSAHERNPSVKKEVSNNRIKAPTETKPSKPQPELRNGAEPAQSLMTCSMCTFVNEPGSTICAMCANTLKPEGMLASWACQSETCKGSKYRNAGDCGVCGLCGERRQPSGAP
ncbi:hypothetical protein VTH82DRAFT_3013 [Thermothelomyces myriococcoides]